MLAINKNDVKYWFIGLIIALAIAVFFIIRPFIGAILSGAVIAYLAYPAYTFLHKKLRNKTICALIVSILILALLVVPMFFVVKTSADEATYLYMRAKQEMASGKLLFECEPDGDAICGATHFINNMLTDEKIKPYVNDLLSRFTNFVMAKSSELIISMPKIIMNIVIAFFVVFYLLREGSELIKKFKQMLPLKPVHQDHIVKTLKDTTNAVFYGSIIIALIQGVLAFVGYLIFGVSSPLLWGIATAFFALVPFVGTTIIWLPISLVMIISSLAQTGSGLWRGIGLLVYGILIVSGIDNVLKPVLIGNKARMHPIIVLVSVLGGLMLFGIAGFLIGPLVVALFKALIDIYSAEKEQLIQ